VVEESVDGIDAIPASPNYTYDAAGRLTVATVRGPSGAERFDYDYQALFLSDEAGNAFVMCSNQTMGANANRSYVHDRAANAFCYDGADRLEGPVDTGMGSTDARFDPVAYDARANTTTLGATTYA
jgi:hypothetical protein